MMDGEFDIDFLPLFTFVYITQGLPIIFPLREILLWNSFFY